MRALCTTGKVTLDGERALDPAARVNAGQRIELRPNAPKPHTVPAGFRIAFEDAHLVVIEKPSGITSVPYERKETGTALDLIRASWKRAGKRATVTPLYTVHRIDKDTSGLLAFAKTKLAERALHEVFQRHTAARAYLAVAEGDVTAARIESQLVADRGDGIRGSTRHPNPTKVSSPSPTSNRSGTTRANRPGRPGERARSSLHFVACDSRPDERIRSASTSPSAAIPWSARRSTSAISCATAASRSPRLASCCTPRCSAFRTP